MTQSLPIYDFSTTPEQRAQENAKIDKAIADAEAAMQVQQLENSINKKDAPAVKSVKSKLVKPKATKKATTKSDRVVGISADENKFLKELLDLYNNKEMDYNAFIESNKAPYTKLLDRYNINK